MQLRADISALARALNEEVPGNLIQLSDEDLAQLEAVLARHPDVWPMGLVDAFKALQRKLRWENVDPGAVPACLTAFFQEKFRRDLDPMALARTIGREIRSSCSECECRC